MIPFSPPRIDNEIINEVISALQSGWITTGPRTRLFETRITEYTGARHTLCLNSATAGLELILRWLDIKKGDEVILPAYTYAATANVVMHCGATPVMVDVNDNDFNISIKNIDRAINNKTKVVMPVDIGGMPCNYDEIMSLCKQRANNFVPGSEIQKSLGRIFVLADAAHSFGAFYKQKTVGSQADAMVFSFHAVKNLTTAEGGAVCLNLPLPFDNLKVYGDLNIKSLHGQNKDAIAKMQKGNWEYDIVEAGFKWNMTDLLAAIGLVELARYNSETLPRRKKIVDQYLSYFSGKSWAQLPTFKTDDKESSYHLFMLRLLGISETQRNDIIRQIAEMDVSVNVHFKPLPLMSFYKSLGYNMSEYPVAYDNYKREISLPVYYDLTDDQVKIVAQTVTHVVEKVLNA